MGDAAKQRLTVTEIRTRYITPAISLAGWPLDQTREEVFYFSAGRIQVMGQHGVRRKPKKSTTPPTADRTAIQARD